MKINRVFFVSFILLLSSMCLNSCSKSDDDDSGSVPKSIEDVKTALVGKWVETSLVGYWTNSESNEKKTESLTFDVKNGEGDKLEIFADGTNTLYEDGRNKGTFPWSVSLNGKNIYVLSVYEGNYRIVSVTSSTLILEQDGLDESKEYWKVTYQKVDSF
jgi:hypothetical protein